MPEVSLAKVVKALDGLLLEPRADGGFRVLGELPDWYAAFDPEPGSDRLRPERVLLFLEGFLIDAERCWAEGAPTELDSGPWTESDRDGRPVTLEATAINTEAGPALLLRRLGEAFLQHQRIMQTARDYGLRHSELVREIEKKEILLHCIIHDLSNPLTAIQGALGLLNARAGEDPDAARLIEIGLRACDRQQAMIRGILDAFSAEAAGWAADGPDPERAADVRALAEDMIRVMGPAYARAGVELDLDAAPDAGGPVLADAARLERVIANLLENALRHSPPGRSVTLGLSAEGSGVLVTVDDQGSGVPPERARRLFQKFGGAGAAGGKAGLGLYFCRITIEAWGGDIGYCARVAGGSRFWFTLNRAG
jgi:signal transduction histidine kinase